MDDETWKRLSRDPEYFMLNLDAISRGERPEDTRTPKPPPEYIGRGHPQFNEIVVQRVADIASRRLIVI